MLVVLLTEAAGMLPPLPPAALPGLMTARSLLLVLLFLPFIVYAVAILPLLFASLYALNHAVRSAARFNDPVLPAPLPAGPT